MDYIKPTKKTLIQLWTFKEKFTKFNKFLVFKRRKKDIPLILHDNINPKRHLEKSNLHFNN